jgi:hypothetical protein
MGVWRMPRARSINITGEGQCFVVAGYHEGVATSRVRAQRNS